MSNLSITRFPRKILVEHNKLSYGTKKLNVWELAVELIMKNFYFYITLSFSNYNSLVMSYIVVQSRYKSDLFSVLVIQMLNIWIIQSWK